MKQGLFSVPLIALATVTMLLSGCNTATQQTAAAPTPVPTPVAPQPPQIDYAKIRPNELGSIPVIMYHEVKGTKDTDLIRSVKSFQEDLEVLRKNGFYPVNLGDVVNNEIDVPAGKSPVVLTFDDARGTQFRLNETPDALKVAPDCAVGIMEAFAKQHPTDWALRGTFFVLPKSKATLEPFGQAGLGDQKMAYLVKQGFEQANHSTLHNSFRNYTAADIQRELGNAHKVITAAVPEAKLQVVALPMGVFPKNKELWKYLLKGEFEGTTYEYQAAFLAAWRPMPSPASKEYDPLRLERINSINGTNGIRDWVKKLTSGTSVIPMTRYISDGDPNVVSYPKGMEDKANVAMIEGAGKLANAYEVEGGGTKPIVGAVYGDEPGRNVDTTPPGKGVRQTAVEEPALRVSEEPINE
jgi:hypothetical protein